MKRWYQYIALVIWVCGMSCSASAQAYDGDLDRKISAGYLHVDGRSGVELRYDLGMNDWLSVGMKGTMLFIGKSHSDAEPDFMDGVDLSLPIDVHWDDALKLPSQLDFYTGVGVGFHVLDVHSGLRYSFSETFGVYAQAQYNVFRMLEHARDFPSLYLHKAQLSVGLIINLD
uniref:Outer membrane protein beta-barrel domain-containing protein n=2 Tax=unclassified Prevotella TaxID=2638335 RepID=A0AB33J7Q9_9BACT